MELNNDAYGYMQIVANEAKNSAYKEAKAEGYSNLLTNLHAENAVLTAQKKAGKKMQEQQQQALDIATYESITASVQNRTGMTDDEMKNVKKFAGNVLQAESTGNWKATSATSSAAGGYQFIKDSVVPAVNRMEELLARDKKKLPEWAANLRSDYGSNISEATHRKLITGLSPAKQASLFMADISEKTVGGTSGLGDQLLIGVGQGSAKAEALLYLLGHHTSYGDKGVMNNVRNTWKDLTDSDQQEIENYIDSLAK